MAEKITIAQLDIDNAALEKTQAAYLKQITAIRTEQKALRKSTEGLNSASTKELETYAKKDAELKKLTTSYNQQKNILAETTTGVKNLSSALEKEVKSVRDAQKNNSKLVKIRNQVNTKTKEGQKAITQINAKLTRNNALIRKNSSALEKQRLNIGNYGSALRGVGSILRSAGLVGGVAGLVLAFRGLFNIVAKFQSGVSNLAAVLDKPISQIKELTDNAIKLGASTAKTATEVLGLQEAYARLGFKQKEIIDLTKPTINASVAMNSSLSDTAELTGAVVNSFDELSTADAPLILDQITAATQNSALTFEKLQTGIPNVAAAASAADVPFSKLLALLGKLADSGIDASKSSTSLRNIFIESAASGLSYEQILEKIKGSQDKLTASTDEFGKRAAVSAIALSKNIDSTKELDLVLQGAAGTAQRAADTQLNNLNGAITLLGSAFDGFVLSIENGTGGFARFLKGIIDSTSAMFSFLTPTNQVSEGLKEQRNEVNSLVFQLGKLNTTEEDRVKLINRLNEIAPDLVSTLDDQGVATDKTRLALDKLNNSFVANIALQIKAEEITEVATKEAEARLNLFEKEAQLRDELSKIRREGTNEQKILIDQGQKEGKTNVEIAESLNLGISSLNEYAIRVQVAENVLKKAEGATSLLRDETERLKQSFIDNGFIAESVAKDVEDSIVTTTTILDSILSNSASKKIEGFDALGEIEDLYLDERIQALKNHNDERLKEIDERLEKELQKLKEGEEVKKAIINGGINLASEAANAALTVRSNNLNQSYDEERLRLTEKYDTELLLLRDRLDKGELSEEKFAESKQALDKKVAENKYKIDVAQFNSEKKLALQRIAIETAIGVAKAFANFLPPFNFINAGIVTASGLIQLGVVSSQNPPPMPKFATGTKRVLGDGTETSDSVPAMLSKNERIVDAKNNRKIGFDLSNNQLATAAQMYRSFGFNGGASMNGQAIVDAIDKNTKVLKGKSVPHTSVHVSDGHRVINKSKYLT